MTCESRRVCDVHERRSEERTGSSRNRHSASPPAQLRFGRRSIIGMRSEEVQITEHPSLGRRQVWEINERNEQRRCVYVSVKMRLAKASGSSSIGTAHLRKEGTSHLKKAWRGLNWGWGGGGGGEGPRHNIRVIRKDGDGKSEGFFFNTQGNRETPSTCNVPCACHLGRGKVGHRSLRFASRGVCMLTVPDHRLCGPQRHI